MEEPTRSTQPSLITAPLGLEADPDGEAADAVVNNGIMSSSRMRAGSSRSATDQRDAGAVEDAPADDAAPAAKEAVDTKRGTAAPLPADTVGKAKAAATGGKAKEAAADRSAADAPAVPAETTATDGAGRPSSRA